MNAQAAAWHARMLEPKSEEEVAAFEAWLARDPANSRAYAKIEAISLAGTALPRRLLDLDERRRTGALAWRPTLALVALLAVVLGGAWVFQMASSPAFAAIANDGPAVRSLRLSDGSRVFLDVDAEIGVRIGSGRREITIRRGRVRIAPAPGSRPLRVTARGLQIDPSGQRIDVVIDGDRAILAALGINPARGTVEVVAGSERFRLGAGEAAVVSRKGRRRATIEPFWPLGRVQFKQAPLASVLKPANAIGDPDVIAADSGVAAMRVTAVLDLRDTRRLARKLATALDLTIEDRGSELILRP